MKLPILAFYGIIIFHVIIRNRKLNGNIEKLKNTLANIGNRWASN